MGQLQVEEDLPLAATFGLRSWCTPVSANLKDFPFALPAPSPLRRKGGGFVKWPVYLHEKILLCPSSALTTAEEGKEVRKVACCMAALSILSVLTTAEEWMEVHDVDAKGKTRSMQEEGCCPRHSCFLDECQS